MYVCMYVCMYVVCVYSHSFKGTLYMGEKFCIRLTCRVGVKMENGRRYEGELGGKTKPWHKNSPSGNERGRVYNERAFKRDNLKVTPGGIT